jgi:hypothetical protein
VAISAKRVPMASRQSQSANALRAAGTAEAPKEKPVCSGCAAENAESPCKVVATGACKNSAGARLRDGIARPPADEQAGMSCRKQHFGSAPDITGSRPLRLGDDWRAG